MQKKIRVRSPNTPETILQAAGRVIRRAGSTGLTIDAVAAEAGLSKGGVLHHFASKDALIAAMVSHQLGRMQEELAAIEARVGPAAVAPLLALIEHARAGYCDEDHFPPALVVASVESPGALDGFRATLEAKRAQLAADPGRPNEALVLLFAMLGLLLTKSLGFYAFDAEQAGIFLDTIDRMARRLPSRADD